MDIVLDNRNNQAEDDDMIPFFSLLSRFTVYEIPEYTYGEFEVISVSQKLHTNAIIQIASSVWKSGSRDIRDVLKIAKLCNLSDTEEDITRLIAIRDKYRKTGNDYNN